MGYKGVDTTELILDGCRVPVAAHQMMVMAARNKDAGRQSDLEAGMAKYLARTRARRHTPGRRSSTCPGASGCASTYWHPVRSTSRASAAPRRTGLSATSTAPASAQPPSRSVTVAGAAAMANSGSQHFTFLGDDNHLDG
jgi:hypothetical protein